MPVTTYQTFASIYDEGLRAGADAATRAGLSWTATVLKAALLPWFVVVGAQIALGQFSLGKLLGYGTRIALVLWLAVGAAYTTVIADTIVDGIPNEIASAINGEGARVTFAEGFDRLAAQTDYFTAQIKGQATGYITGIPTRFAADAYNGGAKTFLGLFFVVWIVVRIATRILVAGLSFFLLLLIFETTRGFVMDYLGKLVSVIAWMLMTSITVRVLLDGCKVYINNAIANPGASLDEQLSMLWTIGTWFLACAMIALIVPALAMVGSGFFVGAAQGAATMAIGKAVAGGAGAAQAIGDGGARAAATQAQTRLAAQNAARARATAVRLSP